MIIWSQRLASIQPRTSPPKFGPACPLPRTHSITYEAFMLTARSASKIARPSCCVVIVISHCRACSSEIVLSVSNSVVALHSRSDSVHVPKNIVQNVHSCYYHVSECQRNPRFLVTWEIIILASAIMDLDSATLDLDFLASSASCKIRHDATQHGDTSMCGTFVDVRKIHLFPDWNAEFHAGRNRVIAVEMHI